MNFLFKGRNLKMSPMKYWSFLLGLDVLTRWSIYHTICHSGDTQMLSTKWYLRSDLLGTVNTLEPEQNGQYFANSIFKSISWKKKDAFWNPEGSIGKTSALAQIMAWRLFEAMSLTSQEWVGRLRGNKKRINRLNTMYQNREIPGSLFSTKTPSYGYRDPHDKPKTVWRPSQVYNGNPYTDKTVFS